MARLGACAIVPASAGAFQREESDGTALAPRLSLFGRIGRFVLHYLEMCMCIGLVVGDLIYFSIAGALGYSKPFTELPVLSALMVTFTMTAPMTAWMLHRGMPRRAV